MVSELVETEPLLRRPLYLTSYICPWLCQNIYIKIIYGTNRSLYLKHKTILLYLLDVFNEIHILSRSLSCHLFFLVVSFFVCFVCFLFSVVELVLRN